ncbi:unnamed protein product [Mytilus coruscus]|uniref:Ig-like domain-containing protein n=1 Tax=Mytilus coruscus TaxID=42192 RepID=A0A6J8ET22_MYTCO|nr:unnamed protein product [Mytilus coruscus]
MHLDVTESTELDIYGKRRNWNLSAYFNQFEFNPSLTHLSRLEIVSKVGAGDFSLMIKNASVFDEGLYECDYQDKNNTIENRRYFLQIKALPSEIEFVNSTNDTITGIEQQPLSVVCRVKRGKPPETLTLKRMAITVKAGGHGSIVYRFNPEKIDHNIQFLCEAKSPLTSLPLRKTVKINIKCKFVLTFCIQ